MIEHRVILRGESDWQRLRQVFTELRDAPLLYEVIVREVRTKRSIEQNARYWALLTDIAHHVEDENKKKYSPEVWHEYFKAMFLGKDCVLIDGDAKFLPKSTTKMSLIEFNDYMAQVEAWAIDHGVTLRWDE